MLLNFIQYSINNAIEDADAGDFYIVIGNHKSSANSEKTVKEELIFGKKVSNTEYAYLIDKNQWTTNTIYDTYLEANANPYYIINQNNDVYKCIWNANGAASNAEPISKTNELIETSDNYIWKYMYSITSANLSTFGSTTEIPITANTDVVANSVAGTIDFVRVNDGGTGFTLYNTGTVSQVINSKILKIDDTASNTANAYLDSALYISNGTGAGTLRIINRSFANSSGKYVEFSANITAATDSEYVISPRVAVTDRAGSGFLAYSTVADGTISAITVVDPGSGYLNPTMNLVTSTVVTQPNTTLFISPTGGHGSNVELELESKKLYMTQNFLLTENETLPNTNFSYYQAALVFNPTVDVQGQNTVSYGISIDANNSLSVDDYIVGETSNASGYVYWANSTHFKLNNIIGAFTNSENLILEDESTIDNINISKSDDASGGDIIFYYNNEDGIDRTLNTSEDLGFIINLENN